MAGLPRSLIWECLPLQNQPHLHRDTQDSSTSEAALDWSRQCEPWCCYRRWEIISFSCVRFSDGYPAKNIAAHLLITGAVWDSSISPSPTNCWGTNSRSIRNINSYFLYKFTSLKIPFRKKKILKNERGLLRTLAALSDDPSSITMIYTR